MQTIKKVNIGFLFLFILGLISCHSDDQEIIGIEGDSIKLSKKEVKVSAESNEVLITTEGTHWWVNTITFNGNNFHENEFYENQTNTPTGDFLFETPDFSVERKNTTEIHLFITKNNSGAERTLQLSLQSGNYFDNITLIQAAN